jgi:L-histidine N-alpha-methyltransferase
MNRASGGCGGTRRGRGRDHFDLAWTPLQVAHVTAARFEVKMAGGVTDRDGTMAREVRAGLACPQRSIPPKYFYDARGSRLFDAICDLPEYYLTRAEASLLDRYADDIVSGVGATALVEIGSGMARKIGPLVQALCARTAEARYVPFDIAAEPIEASARTLLARYPRLRVCGLVGDFSFDLPRLSIAAPASAGARLFAFLGSTIGNLDERAASAFLCQVALLLAGCDRFLLGIDLVKDERVLHAAYNDAQGVTAAFNKNVLRVLSCALDGDFDERAFDHLAFYDGERQRIEMHLVSQRRQVATLRAIDLRVDLAAGERIMTEVSRKFTRAGVERMLALGGMALERWFPADDGAFSLCLARRA